MLTSNQKASALAFMVEFGRFLTLTPLFVIVNFVYIIKKKQKQK